MRADGRTDGQTETDRHRQTQTDRQTDMTRLVVTSRNFAKAHKNTGCFRESFYDRR